MTLIITASADIIVPNGVKPSAGTMLTDMQNFQTCPNGWQHMHARRFVLPNKD